MTTKRFMTLFISVSLFVPITLYGQDGNLSAAQSLNEAKALLLPLKYGYAFDENIAGEDTGQYNWEKSPGRAFLLSAVVPGAGELYAGAKWRALGFFGLEALGWYGWYNRKSRGEELEEEYKEFANNHWRLQDYINFMDAHEYCGVEGHHLYLSWQVNDEYHSILLDNNFKERVTQEEGVFGTNAVESFLSDSLGTGSLAPVRSRDYYENIGKYHQFACGWDDFFDVNNPNDTTLTISDNRDDYLTQRKDSNASLKAATKFITVVMFNHLFSALHAQLIAKQYDSEKMEKVSWHVSLIPGYRRRELIQGINLSLHF